ncbi:hypothetical protein [Vibrio sp. SCSIO 43136]|uniref:hypothetical protein n=1 Tax=Vibrio sp. SCSIO 43136 TaxID=2819101 RepID=UPI002074B9B3|nr:hypothetical protein [Vibrio sp. SCSIO 43136]USD67936.1 hypothetical protein J4N39_17280 [Vibrio sp. SCSIO 43136]
MATMSEQVRHYPALITAFIAAALFVCALIGWSPVITSVTIPYRKVLLALISSHLISSHLISSVFIARGILGIPVVIFSQSPYALELRSRKVFMILSSLICLLIGA